MPLISPTEGWAKIKIEKPDMYRTPMLDGNIASLDNEGGQEGLRKPSVDFRKNELRNRRGPWMRGGLRDPKDNLVPGNNTFPNLAQRNFATGMKQHTTGKYCSKTRPRCSKLEYRIFVFRYRNWP